MWTPAHSASSAHGARCPAGRVLCLSLRESLPVRGRRPPHWTEFLSRIAALNTQDFHFFLDHFTATAPTSFSLLLLDNGAFHKARALQLLPNLGLLFFPPYTPELNPIERLWRDLKDWLAQYRPASLRQLSVLLGKRLKLYSAATYRSLTGFPYSLKTAQTVTGL